MPVTLVDTSVLARLLERDSRKGIAAVKAVRDSDADAGELSVCAQVLMEFWVVATRPAESNGYGLTAAEADACLTDFLDSFTLLPDPPDLFERWREIVVEHQVRGKPAHDARLVVLMRGYTAKRVLTFNARDFRRYGDIEIMVPASDSSG